jgi:spermidine/putrescine transport system permease protein
MKEMEVQPKGVSRLRRLGPYLFLSPGMILIGVFFLLPLAMMFTYSFYTRVTGGSMEAVFTLDNYARIFTKALYSKVLVKTLWLALLVTGVSLLLSYPLSYFMARTKSRLKPYMLLAVITPLWTSVIIRSYGWMVILGSHGIINSFLGLFGIEPVRLLWNQTGTIIGFVQILLPYMVLPLYASMEAIDVSLEEASRTLGAGNLRTFWRVTLPLSLPGAATGALMVFIITIGTFLIPALLGGPSQVVVPMMIYEQIGTLNYPLAASLSMVLLVIVLILTGTFNRFFGLERLGGFYG